MARIFSNLELGTSDLDRSQTLWVYNALDCCVTHEIHSTIQAKLTPTTKRVYDFELGMLGDRISPNLLATGARLATRMSFAEAREVLGWFVPQPPSTEVLEQTILGLGHHTAAEDLQGAGHQRGNEDGEECQQVPVEEKRRRAVLVSRQAEKQRESS